ncbi:MAG: hypothetical protein IJ233_05770 [Pyramidobacter sp.]|nr:hypothetical protein [Pyramidobacter sp.]
MRATVVDVLAVLVRVFVMDAAAAMGMLVVVAVLMLMLVLMSFAGEAGPALRLADLVVIQKRIVHCFALLFPRRGKKYLFFRAVRAVPIIAQMARKFTMEGRALHSGEETC